MARSVGLKSAEFGRRVPPVAYRLWRAVMMAHGAALIPQQPLGHSPPHPGDPWDTAGGVP
jgi:hypothetical protein